MPAYKLLQRIFKTLVILSIVVQAYSCNENKKASIQQLTVKTDSIQVLLTQASADGISAKDRSHLLEKAYGQTQKLKNDSLKNKYLKDLSYLFTRNQNSNLFRRINKEAINQSIKIQDSLGLATLHWDFAIFHRYVTIQMDSAYYQYVKAEKIFSALGDDYDSGRVIRSMAWIQNLIGDFTGSDLTATKSIEKLKPLNKFGELSSSYGLMGDNAKLLFEFDRSLENYNKALNYLKKNKGSLFDIQSFNNNFGLVYQKNDEHKKAIIYFTKVLNIDSLQIKNPMLYGRVINNLAYSYLKTDNLEQLPLLFSKAIHFQDSIGDIGGMTSSTHRLAEYFLQTKDTTNALVHLQLAKTYATQQSSNKRLVQILRMYSKVDPENAGSHAEAAFNLNDSLQIQERQIRNKFARIEFETDEQIAENQLLERENQLWIGIAAALLLLGFSSYVIIRQRSRNQKLRFEEQQQVSNQEIFNLLLAQNEKVEEVKKSEQKRVSEELHDGVLGRMLGARMMLLGLNKKTDPEAIAERGKAISMLQDVEGEVRSISHELSHAAYQKIHNFILSIKDLLQSVESSSKIKIDFNHADDLDYDALTGEIKINLYRIIQESVQNAVKHAACKNINISFDADFESLNVVIADDGKGFVIEKGKKGIGTRNITSRIEKINGTWQVDSRLGKGTSVRLQIPIVANDNSNNIRIPQEELQEF